MQTRVCIPLGSYDGIMISNIIQSLFVAFSKYGDKTAN